MLYLHPLLQERKKLFPVATTGRSFTMKKISTKVLVTAGLLVALHIILSRFCSINAWNIKIGFAFVPTFVAAYLYGPAIGVVVGALGDFLGATLFPIGQYFPGFTLSCALTGLVFGLFLHKKQSVPRIAAAVCDELLISFLLTSFWISTLYGAPYLPLLGTRIVQCLIMMPIEFVGITIIMKALNRVPKETFV